MSLLALIRKGGVAKAATATTATLATQGGKKTGTVAIVATVAVANPTSSKPFDREPFEERVAFREFDGGLSQEDAKLPPNVPAAALTIASAERAPRHTDIHTHAELIALVDTVADFHGFNPEQRAEAKEIALADLEAALECFRELAAKIPGVQAATDDRIMCLVS